MWLWIVALAVIIAGLVAIAIGVGLLLDSLAERAEMEANLARRERLHARGLIR